MAPGQPLLAVTPEATRPGSTRASRPGSQSRRVSVEERRRAEGRNAEERRKSELEALHAANELREFVNQKEGSALRAWCKHFDPDNDQKISQSQFLRGMSKMGYNGDAAALFKSLDADRSGELSLEEIDAYASGQWRRFRAFCVQNFEDPEDMVRRLGKKVEIEQRRGGAQVLQGGPDVWTVTQAQFTDNVRALGWSSGYEDMLFPAMNVHDKDAISVEDLKWLEMEQRRQKRKELAKKKALQENHTRNKDANFKGREACLADFKNYLRRKYGSFLRAWFKALSPDGAMILRRSEVFKACAQLGWPGNVRLLFSAFDKDNSGYVSIEELDARAAELLAHFHDFVMSKFGSATAAFHAFDKYNQKKLKQHEFISQVKNHGFQHPAKLLFHGLDHKEMKAVMLEDMLFLDRWKPPAFLTRTANPQAMEEFKALLVRNYKNFLKAWRHCLDQDSSNRCNYDEFDAACQKLKFKGDVAGAWRALDEDLSGYITLQEIDPASSSALANFRRWCDEEFGSVRSAFSVFDNSGDNEVNYREWRRSLRFYGFEGDASTLFYALDVERSGTLALQEVEFLDEWIFPGASTTQEASSSTYSSQVLGEPPVPQHVTTQYVTEGPGPAAYAAGHGVGSGPPAPMRPFPGAFSFRKRTGGTMLLPPTPRDAGEEPSPLDYDSRPGWSTMAPSKPSWPFSKEARKSNEPVDNEEEEQSPGPGAYTPLTAPAVAVACTPRRALKVHPFFREGLGKRTQFTPRQDILALPRV
ncbi:unnamed protein product [Symbiodinium sp. CCMP2456]|nr:unnamed protein product [Symbiodinium sp. CCMP2456]